MRFELDLGPFCVMQFGPETMDTYGIHSISHDGSTVYIYTVNPNLGKGKFPLDSRSVRPEQGDPLRELLENAVDPGVILDYLYDAGILPFGGGEPFELKSF